MESVLNIDLLWVGVAVAGAGTLGYSIYFSDRKSATSRAFLFFALASIGWSIVNFASARTTDPSRVLWLIRLVLFFATWHAFSFFVLAFHFPSREPRLKRSVFFGLLAWTATISLTTLTPLVFSAVTAIYPAVVTEVGPGIGLFALTIFGFVGMGVVSLVRKFLRIQGAERHQMEFVLTGMVLTFAFLIIFEFVFPAFLNIPTLVPFGGLFLLPFILGTAYAILKYRLFNVRVALFGVLTFVLATATFFDVLLSDSLSLVLYRSTELVLVLIAGIWLIRSMIHEFELEEELQETNGRQETLIRFISHEVKNFLAKDMGAFASLAEGDFGALPEPMRHFVEAALAQSRGGAASVKDILTAANQKKGTIEYKKEAIDLKEVVSALIEKERSLAERKGLRLALSIPEGAEYQTVGDRAELADHVFGNLIENAINYTPSGSVEVSLKKEADKYIFAVKDTGVGITDEDKKRLFTEGGHGKDSQTINVHSTGYGLFIAKNIVEAHKGTIRAESEGAGKGSMFIVELPG